MIIDGKIIAQKILEELESKKRPDKKMVAILVGDNAASLSFLKKKALVARSLGVKFELLRLSAKISQKALEARIKILAKDKNVGGIIVQLPLPKKFKRDKVVSAIPEEKDVDVLVGTNLKILSPAVGTLIRIFEEIDFNPRRKKAVVVGSGFVTGKPIINWFLTQVSKLTVIKRGGMDREVLREADCIVTGVGKPNFITADCIKKGAVVVDFGYAKKGKKLFGDVDFKNIFKKAKVTPTPGGTGPIVVAQLFVNFYDIN